MGLIAIGVLALMSYVTVSFITESMALGNALVRYERKKKAEGVRMTEFGSVVKNPHADGGEGKEDGTKKEEKGMESMNYKN